MNRILRATACAILVTSGTARAGNGFNDFAFGPEGEAMGGADLAVSRDTGAINVNPAGLTQIPGSAFDITLEPFGFAGVRHRDGLGNHSKPDNPVGVSMNGGYAMHLSPDLVTGIGFFGQGGVGFVYNDIRTPFGNRDDASSIFGAFKVAPGLAWRVSDRLSVGASAGIVWSTARQKFFYDTSVPAMEGLPNGFSGFRVDSLSGWSGGLKLGFQYHPGPDWTIGVAYSDEIPIRLEGGEARFNFEEQGLGRVIYRDASVKGLTLAGEIGGGVAWQATPKLLLATEINWIDWSAADKKSVLSVSNPDVEAAPAQLRIEQTLNFRDQWVVALGAEWKASPASTYRAGINYGRNPVPPDSLSPLLDLIGTTTVSVGYARELSEHWTFKSVLLVQFRKDVEYENPESPFGPSRETWGGVIVLLGVSRRW